MSKVNTNVYCFQNSQNREHQKYRFMECYCVARNKPVRREITKRQTAMAIIYYFVVLRFACISWTLLWLASTQSTFLKIFRCSWFCEFDSNINNLFHFFVSLKKHPVVCLILIASQATFNLPVRLQFIIIYWWCI